MDVYALVHYLIFVVEENQREIRAAGLLLLAYTVPAHAYVGPGSGLELIGFVLSLGFWAGAALISMFLWPMYALLRWLRSPLKKSSPPEPEKIIAEPARDDDRE